jgi:hypothetical protein
MIRISYYDFFQVYESSLLLRKSSKFGAAMASVLHSILFCMLCVLALDKISPFVEGNYIHSHVL